jgi:transposase InsO family protein
MIPKIMFEEEHKTVRIPVINFSAVPIHLPSQFPLVKLQRLPPQTPTRPPQAQIKSCIRSAGCKTDQPTKRSQGDVNDRVRLKEVLLELQLDAKSFKKGPWSKIEALILKNLKVFPLDPGAPGISKLPPMDITTTGEPVRCRPYKTSPQDRDFLKDTINRLLESGLITPSNSPWGFPVLVARNREGKMRMCVNYKKLNAQTRLDAYPLPKIEEILNALGGHFYYSTLDLCQGYHQMLLSTVPDENGYTAQDKSSMVTHMGTFSWKVVGFGMSNSPGTFTRGIDMVLSGLHWTTCCAFVDDIVIFSDTFDAHCADIEKVFARLMQYDLKVKPSKCQLFLKKIQFLGHILSEDGIEPISARIEAIMLIDRPRTLTDLRSFVATCQYYRRYVKDFASIAAPLYELTTKELLPYKPWAVPSKYEDSFRNLKRAMAGSEVLKLPNYSQPYFISVDASQQGFGAILEQDFLVMDKHGKERKRRHPVYYASRRTTPREFKLESTHREASAVVWALHFYRYFIQGIPTTVYTDHGPLTWIMATEFENTPLAKYAARLQEWQATVTIKYKPGRIHANADGPSRLPVKMLLSKDVEDTDDIIVPDSYASTVVVKKSTPYGQMISNLRGLNADPTVPVWQKVFHQVVGTTEFLDRVRTEQKAEPECRAIYRHMSGTAGIVPESQTAETIRDHERLVTLTKAMVLKNKLLYRVATLKRSANSPTEKIAQLYIPLKCRKELLTALHDHPTAAHIGQSKMLTLIQQRYYWPSYIADIAEWVSTCPLCQRYKSTRDMNSGLLHPKARIGAMHTLCIDFVEGFPPYQGYTCILTVVCDFTRWVWFIPCRSQTAVDAAKAIYKHVLMNHACVRRIVSDRGSAFESDMFQHLCERFGIKKARTTAYHPQTNANAERLHRHYPKALAMLSKSLKDWPKYVDEVAFAYRTTPISGIGYSPFELLYGRSPILPVDYLTSCEQDLQVDRQKYQLDFPQRMKAMWDLVHETNLKNAAQQKKQHDKDKVEAVFLPGSHVLLFRPSAALGPRKLETDWHGPFLVVGTVHTSTRTYRLQDEKTGETFTADVTNMVIFRPVRKPQYDEQKNPEEPGLINDEDLEWNSGDFDVTPFGQLSRAEQRNIVTRAISTINQTNAKFEVRRSTLVGLDRDMSNGVFAKTPFLEGADMLEYKGERLSADENQQRYPNGDGNYVFELPDGDFIDAIDPMLSGPARFINCTGEHQEPNCKVVGENGKLICKATCDIKIGDELFFEYGIGYEWKQGERKSRPTQPPTSGSLPKPGNSGTSSGPRGSDDSKCGFDYSNHDFKHAGTSSGPRGSDDPNSGTSSGPRGSDDSKHSDDLPRAPLRSAERHLPATFKIEDLDEDSMIIYKDEESKDALQGWSLGRVQAVDLELSVIEAQRFGSYIYAKDKEKILVAKWFPRYIDPKDETEVFTTRPISRLLPVVDWVPAKNILAHSFYLTNAPHHRIPAPVAKGTISMQTTVA